MVGAGSACEERRRARAARASDGQDIARARVEGGHRLPRSRRPDEAARAARLRAGRVRLHDVHRELRPARRGGRHGGRGERPGRGRGVVRQPQLRGAHPPARARELPGVTPARRRLRAGRTGRHRPDVGATGRRERRTPRVSRRHLADGRRDPFGHRLGHRPELVPTDVRRRVRGRRSLAGAADPGGRSLRWDASSTYVAAPRSSRA
jgi:hypothetical protein